MEIWNLELEIFNLRIGLYSPYWSTMGGGEKYMLDIARCFPEDEIIFIGDNNNLFEDAKNRFGFTHKNVKMVTDYKREDGKLKKENLQGFDLFFYQCDGSVFIPFAKKNILLVQSPVHSPQRSLKDKIKLMFWQKVVCNSVFTANFVKQKTGINSTILNPSIEKIPELHKEDIILSVGRFFPHLHSKKQEVLIEIFKKLYDSTLCHSSESWNLILAGAVADSDREYLNSLKEQTKGYPIEFHENISYGEIKKLYGKAKIYWHAAGFGEDLKKHPEKAEHFGISTVEAISAGCYPFVFKGGGQTEIIGDNREFYWQTEQELINKTTDLITNYELPARNSLRESVAGGRITNYEKIRHIPEKYSFENFQNNLHEIIK